VVKPKHDIEGWKDFDRLSGRWTKDAQCVELHRVLLWEGWVGWRWLMSRL